MRGGGVCRKHQPCSNLLQMWGTESLCSRLSGSGNEVLRMRETGKEKSCFGLGFCLFTFVRVTSLAIALRQTVVHSTRPERSATSVAQLDISLAIVLPMKPMGPSQRHRLHPQWRKRLPHQVFLLQLASLRLSLNTPFQ